MNNLSLESFYVVVLKYYAFDNLSYDIFADVSSFSSISGKHVMWHHSTPFDGFGILILIIEGISDSKIREIINPLMSGGNKKVTHT